MSSRLQTPEELGLPEAFERWRPVQEDMVDFLKGSTRRIKAVCAPTGGGKSAVYVGEALRLKKATCFVTESRTLQDQLCGTFGEVGMVDLRGRSNYPCNLKQGELTCEQGWHSRCPDKGTMRCGASAAGINAACSLLVCTNYPKWIHDRKHGHGLKHIERVVFDEAHETHPALGQAMQITLHHREIERDLGINFPPMDDAQFFASWKVWARKARSLADELMRQAQGAMASVSSPRPKDIKDYAHYRNLSRRLAILGTANVENWLVEEVEQGYQFDPISLARYAESALFLGVPDITLMSATLRPKSLWLLGVGRDAYDFKDFPSDFDPKRAPIYYIPTMRVDAKAHSLSLLWAKLDQIAARRRDRNGLVHTVSHLRKDEILGFSRFAASMFYNAKGEPPTAMIEQFVRAYPGAILVSPSVGQGHDFSFSRAEWQFICKVPFPPMTKILKARGEKDPEYYAYLTMQKLWQMFGRINRDRLDSGESFLADEHWEWFGRRYNHLRPKWSNAFIKQVEVLPPPPPRLE